MKTGRKFFFSLIFCTLLLGTYAEVEGIAYEQVTAAQYCDFLNHVAATDSPHLYDEAISVDPEVASILRVGASGQRQYEVIAGRENFPICYVNEFDKAYYEKWLRNSEPSEEETFMPYEKSESLLKSNQGGFISDSLENFQTLTLTGSAALEKNDSFFDETTIAKIGLAFLAVTMIEKGVRPSTPSNASSRQRFSDERNFIARNNARPLKSGDKTMDISSTPKNYDSCSITPLVKELQSLVPVQKFNGVKITVVPPKEREISCRHVINDMHAIPKNRVIKEKNSAQIAPANPFWQGRRIEIVTKAVRGLVGFLTIPQDSKIIADEILKQGKGNDNPLPNHRIIAGETTPLLEKR
ncbi:MAG: hypothetical protein ACH346_02435 [Chthoniobacterales bacterium]